MRAALVPSLGRCIRWSLACAALTGCGGNRSSSSAAPLSLTPARAGPGGVVTSNILRSDYAGSAACASCHGAHLRSVVEVAHASDDPRTGRGGGTRAFRRVHVPLQRATKRAWNDDGADRFVTLFSHEFGDHTYRVTRVIGGRYREDFAGVEVARAKTGARTLGDPDHELVLPVSYVFSTGSFRLKGYSVMVHERPGMKAGGVWNQTCIFCHNVAPYFSDLLGALYGKGRARVPGRSGRCTPPGIAKEASRRSRTRADSRKHCATRWRSSGRALRGTARTIRRLLGRTIARTRDHFTGTRLVEVGIGCESCHGGSKAHAANPAEKPTFEPRAPFLRAAHSESAGKAECD